MRYVGFHYVVQTNLNSRSSSSSFLLLLLFFDLCSLIHHPPSTFLPLQWFHLPQWLTLIGTLAEERRKQCCLDSLPALLKPTTTGQWCLRLLLPNPAALAFLPSCTCGPVSCLSSLLAPLVPPNLTTHCISLFQGSHLCVLFRMRQRYCEAEGWQASETVPEGSLACSGWQGSSCSSGKHFLCAVTGYASSRCWGSASEWSRGGLPAHTRLIVQGKAVE